MTAQNLKSKLDKLGCSIIETGRKIVFTIKGLEYNANIQDGTVITLYRTLGQDSVSGEGEYIFYPNFNALLKAALR